MKTKQAHIKAKFETREENAKNLSGDKELVSAYKIVDKTSERAIVDCRVWATKSGSTFYASIWVNIKKAKRPESFEHGCTSGYGTAGGWFYDKESSSIGEAISSAGIGLYGSPYTHHHEKPDFKKRANIGGKGCHKEALLAIAYAAGYNNCIMVEV